MQPVGFEFPSCVSFFFFFPQSISFCPRLLLNSHLCFLSLSSPSLVSDSVCTSPFAVSTRREGKAKRLQRSAISQRTTSRTNWQRRHSFVRGTSSSCCERTSESSSPAPLTCPFTPAHHLHTRTRLSWFGLKWRSWRATSTAVSRKCCSTPCSVLTMWPSCLSVLSRLVWPKAGFSFLTDARLLRWKGKVKRGMKYRLKTGCVWRQCARFSFYTQNNLRCCFERDHDVGDSFRSWVAAAELKWPHVTPLVCLSAHRAPSTMTCVGHVSIWSWCGSTPSWCWWVSCCLPATVTCSIAPLLTSAAGRNWSTARTATLLSTCEWHHSVRTDASSAYGVRTLHH